MLIPASWTFPALAGGTVLEGQPAGGLVGAATGEVEEETGGVDKTTGLVELETRVVLDETGAVLEETGTVEELTAVERFVVTVDIPSLVDVVDEDTGAVVVEATLTGTDDELGLPGAPTGLAEANVEPMGPNLMLE